MRDMRPIMLTCVSGAALFFSLGPLQGQQPNALQPPSAFGTIRDQTARSRALFAEAAKVITHPRCMNCHPSGDRPLQGNAMKQHEPMVVRGEGGHGVPGNQCSSCHHEKNFDHRAGYNISFQSIPGHPRWELAPLEMAWEGKSIGDICRQLVDPQRNGGRDLTLLHEHMAKDDLVGWGWNPGTGRDPAPGTQAQFGDLVQAWIDTGAHCPQ
jgi:hypothetical protein